MVQITEGKIPIWHFGKCSNCDAIFKATDEETRKFKHSDYHSPYELYTETNCPCCKEKNSLQLYSEKDTHAGKEIKREAENV